MYICWCSLDVIEEKGTWDASVPICSPLSAPLSRLPRLNPTLPLPCPPLFAVETPKRTPNELQDQYLGLLHPTQDYFVYGYHSNTKVKMVLVTEKIEKDTEVKRVSAFVAPTQCAHSSPKSVLLCFLLVLASGSHNPPPPPPLPPPSSLLTPSFLSPSSLLPPPRDR